MGTPRNTARNKTPRELALERRRKATKQTLAIARASITGTTLENLLASAPSFRSGSNLRAQTDINRYNKPTVEQLMELENYLRAKSADFARAADSVAECRAEYVATVAISATRANVQV